MKLGLLRSLEKDIRGKIYGPIGLGYISSYLKKNYQEDIKIIIEDDINKLLEWNPDIIGISSLTANFIESLKKTSIVKKTINIPIILGGVHISSIPESLPESIDIGVIGEGEDTMLEICKTKSFTYENLNKIKGIVFHHKGKKIFTHPRSIISDIDTIPPPDRILLRKWTQTILTSRGCPYKCKFCYSNKLWKKFRFHSAQRVVNEIESIIKLFPEQKIITFNDDLFTLNKDRLKEIMRLIKEEKIDRKVEFFCSGRASTIDEEICKLLLSMNVKTIFLGLESGSQRVLSYLKGKDINIKDNQKSIDLCKKHGLKVVASFILGTPVETKSDISKTFWFIFRNRYKLKDFDFCYSTPLPGTNLWRYAKSKKLINDDFQDWDIMDLNYYANKSIYLNEYINQTEFNNIYNYFKKFLGQMIEEYKRNFPPLIDKEIYYKVLRAKLFEIIPKDIENTLIISDDETLKLKFSNLFFYIEKREIEKTIVYIKNFLKRYGYLVFLTFNLLHFYHLIGLLLNLYNQNKVGFIQYISLKRLKQILENNDLEIISINSIKINLDKSYLPVVNWITNYLNKSLGCDLSNELDTVSYLTVTRNKMG